MKQIKLNIMLWLMAVLITVVCSSASNQNDSSRESIRRAKRALQVTVGNRVIPVLKDDPEVKAFCTDMDIDVEEWKMLSPEDFNSQSETTRTYFTGFRDNWLEIYQSGFSSTNSRIIRALGFPAIFPAFVLFITFCCMLIWFLVWLCARNLGDKKPVFYECTMKWFKSAETAKTVLVWTLTICFICLVILYVFWVIWGGMVGSQARHIVCATTAIHSVLVQGFDSNSEFDFPGLYGVYDLLDQMRDGIGKITGPLQTEIGKIDPIAMQTRKEELASSYTTFESELVEDSFTVQNSVNGGVPRWTPDILSSNFTLFRKPLKTEVNLLSGLMTSLISIQSFLPGKNVRSLSVDLDRLEGQIKTLEEDFDRFKTQSRSIPTRAELRRVGLGITIPFFVLLVVWVVFSLLSFNNAFLRQQWLKYRWINYSIFGLLLAGGIVLNLFATVEVILASVLNVLCYSLKGAYEEENFIVKFAKPTDRAYQVVQSCIAPNANGTLDGLMKTQTTTFQFDDLIQSSKKYEKAKLDMDLLGKQLETNLTRRRDMEESDSIGAGDAGIDKAMNTVNGLIASDNDRVVYSDVTSLAQCDTDSFVKSTTSDPANFRTGSDGYCISLKTKSSSNYLNRYTAGQPVSANGPLLTLMTSVDDYQSKMSAFQTKYAAFIAKEEAAKAEILKSKAALDTLNAAFTNLNKIIDDHGGNFMKSLDCGILSEESKRLEYGLCVKAGPPFVVHTAMSIWLGILWFLVSCLYCTAIRWVAYERPKETVGSVYKIEEEADQGELKQGIKEDVHLIVLPEMD
jgi:hypothetical protein